jgi:hypothetical protein
MRYLRAAVLAILASWGSGVLADEANEPKTGWEQPKLPAIKLSHEDWYPPAARFRNLQGRVLVAFDITPAGVAANISILWSENEVFTQSTTRMLAGAHFAVPNNWAATGANRRWRAGVVYRLASPAPSAQQSDDFAIPAEKIYITGSSIPKEHQWPNHGR